MLTVTFSVFHFTLFLCYQIVNGKFSIQRQNVQRSLRCSVSWNTTKVSCPMFFWVADSEFGIRNFFWLYLWPPNWPKLGQMWLNPVKSTKIMFSMFFRALITNSLSDIFFAHSGCSHKSTSTWRPQMAPKEISNAEFVNSPFNHRNLKENYNSIPHLYRKSIFSEWTEISKMINFFHSKCIENKCLGHSGPQTCIPHFVSP